MRAGLCVGRVDDAPMIQLSAYQWRILTFVQSYFAQHCMSPSIREIAEGSGISSTSVVNYNLNDLVGLGLLTRQGGICRTIVLQGANATVGVRP